MDKNQIGFVAGLGTHVNIIDLIMEIKKYKKKDEMSVVYIDLKSAYNTINRKKLFEIIENKKILEKSEIKFLE